MSSKKSNDACATPEIGKSIKVSTTTNVDFIFLS
jgi:hypothetical protein